MSSTMCGMLIMRSTSQVTTASAFLPPSAAAVPSTSAMADDTNAASRPIPMLVDRPETVRTSMSRPRRSVPKRCAGEGTWFFAARSVAVACDARSAPATATTTSSAKHTAPVTSVRVRLAPRSLTGSWNRFASVSIIRHRPLA